MTPEKIESHYIAWEEKLVNKLTQNSFFIKILFLTCLASMFYWGLYPTLTGNFSSWSRFDIIQDRVWYTIGLVFFSPFYFYIPEKLRSLFFVAVMLVVWTGGGLILGLKIGTWILHPLSFYLFYLILKKIHIANRSLDISTKTVLILIIFWSDLYLAALTTIESSSPYLTLISKFRFEYVLIFAISLAFSHNKNSHELLIHPLQLSHSFPLPEESSFSTKHRTWWKGGLNLSLGIFLTWLVSKIATLDILNTQYSSAILYLYFCLFVVAIMNITTGLARVYGLEIKDGTYFLIFARSPMDFWRRSSTYLYQFILGFIFLPTARLSRSTVLALIISILAAVFQIFLLHELFVRGFLILAFPDLKIAAPQIQTLLTVSAGYIGLWTAAELLHRGLIKIFALVFKGDVLTWLSVLLSHLIIIVLTFLFLKLTQ